MVNVWGCEFLVGLRVAKFEVIGVASLYGFEL